MPASYTGGPAKVNVLRLEQGTLFVYQRKPPQSSF
jgi:hypothetical protein